MKKYAYIFLCFCAAIIWGCNPSAQNQKVEEEEVVETNPRFNIYTPVELTTDMSKVSQNDREMLPFLIKAAQIMDELFWMQSYGDKQAFLSQIEDDAVRHFAEINYGPWDRLDGDKPFIDGVGEKPKGATYYPKGLTADDIMNSEVEDKDGLYSNIVKDENGNLKSVPFHVIYEEELAQAAQYLKDAAEICETTSLKNYLELRAKALETDQYYESDVAWLQMADNGIDIIIGPIENYEDKLMNARAAYEAYVLVKDKVWSKKLEKYVSYLPELQEGLPVSAEYKSEKPGTDAQLNAYDVVYYAGDCNAGSKTIAVNLPNDEGIQLDYGTRRSQLKNAMKAKFDKILLPIADELIDPNQRKHITFNAFFTNTMFHEVAHGLGIKNTITFKGTVRRALMEHFSALEEGKADILGLYMVTQLKNKGVLEEGEMMDYYVTFMASIFRSVRFGASSAHGKANMLRFNFFEEKGAFTRNEDGTYTVNQAALESAMNALSAIIIELQGNGDKNGVAALMAEKGTIGDQLQADLDRLEAKGIPVDVVFNQGIDVLGLN